MIWRDDDLGNRRDFDAFCAVDDLFQRHGVAHTVALVASGLDKYPELGPLLRERHLDVQLHCWDHDDLTVSPGARVELALGVDAIERHVGRRPTVLYPPWNRTSPEVEAVASTLGLTVSAEKMSLGQYLRCQDDGVVNFHYWDAAEVALLEPALTLYQQTRRSMKITDYCPRAAPFDTYLMRGKDLIGAEVGVDAGAHAEALLRYCPVAQIFLVDRWPKDYHFGYCHGRLRALGFESRFSMMQRDSVSAAQKFSDEMLDFVYIDQEHDGAVVTADLQAWWRKVKRGGCLGYRNYSSTDTPLKASVDAFVAAHRIRTSIETGEIILFR